jgi:hypothetical protein
VPMVAGEKGSPVATLIPWGWIFGCRCERCRPVTLRRNKPSVVLIVRLMRKCKSASARVAWLTAMVLE